MFRIYNTNFDLIPFLLIKIILRSKFLATKEGVAGEARAEYCWEKIVDVFLKEDPVVYCRHYPVFFLPRQKKSTPSTGRLI